MADDPRFGRRELLIGGAAGLAVAAAGGLGCSGSDKQADARADARRDGGAGEARADAGLDVAQPCSGSAPQPLPAPPSPARVAEVHDAKAVVGSTVDGARVKAMLAAGLKALAKEANLKLAWKRILPDFAPSMRIGIKVNCLSSYLTSSLPLLAALVETLALDLGADAKKIVVWDRRGDELARSKMTAAALGVSVLGTQRSTSDLSGPGYEPKAECILGKSTRLARLLTQETDLTINIALLKTHNISGATGALKNCYGCIDNPGDFHADLNHELPVIYRLDPIWRRMRLHITDGLIAVLKGDTSDPPDAVPGRLLLATDPVALDAHTIALVNTLRGALPPLPATKLQWLDGAAKLNLGTTSRDAQLVEL